MMRSFTSWSAALLCSLVLGACGKGGPSNAAGSASASASPATSARPTASAALDLPAPEALDPERLSQALKCSPTSEGGPCRVLAGFGQCQPAKLETPSGDGRWIGNGYLVRDGAFTDQVMLLRSRRVPLAEVGQGQLAMKVGLATLPDETDLKFHADKAISAASRGDVPKVNNLAIAYLKNLQDWQESYALAAQGNQVFVVAREPFQICFGRDQRVLLVQRAVGAKNLADGLYAELWPATW